MVRASTRGRLACAASSVGDCSSCHAARCSEPPAPTWHHEYVCAFHGVELADNGHVSGLKLKSNGLIETLPGRMIRGLVGLQVLDLSDVRVVDAVLSGSALSAEYVARIHTALAAKDVATLTALSTDLGDDVRHSLLALPTLYGDVSILDKAAQVLRASPLLTQALNDLRWLATHLDAVGVRSTRPRTEPRTSVRGSRVKAASYG